MKTLISPERVAGMAFRAPDFISPEAISEATIVAAEERFIRPVLGAALCDALADGAWPELLEDYVAPALALYVKALMLPTLAVQAGAAGVAEVNSRNLARAGEAKLRAAVKRLQGDALALMRRAVEHIEGARDGSGSGSGSGAGSGAYPEYDPAQNALHRCSIEGGIALLFN